MTARQWKYAGAVVVVAAVGILWVTGHPLAALFVGGAAPLIDA